MADPTGEADGGALRLDFDRRLMLQFRGSVIASDGGLLVYSELDDAMGLTDTGADTLADARTGKNGGHWLGGLLRQSVFGRLAGYEDVNDADRLCCDPAMPFVFNQLGDLERCALRFGNVHSADGWRAVLEPVIARYRGTVKRLYFRGDAASASPKMYEFLEAEGIGYTIRLPANRVLRDKIGYLLMRPVGRPSHEVRRSYASFSYQAQSWKKPRRVAKVEWHPGQLYPRVGLIVTNLARPAERVVAFYNRAARRSNGSRKAKAHGRGCHAARSPATPSASSSMRWPTTSATSCGRWRCPRRRSRSRWPACARS
jgi:Transposase DDE domain group 1